LFNIIYCTKQGEKREINEDCLLVINKITKECGRKRIGNSYFLAAVADGMGGHQKGELASCEVLKYLKEKKPTDKNSLVAVLIEAKHALEEIAGENHMEIGTAIAGIIYYKENFLIFNVGDCRIYKIDENNSLTQLSYDHTLANQLLNLKVSQKNIQIKQKNVLTSAITGGMGNEDFEVFISETSLKNGESLIICSDGFWNNLEKNMVKLSKVKRPLTFLKKIIKKEKMSDDYSFILIKKKKNLLNFLKRDKLC